MKFIKNNRKFTFILLFFALITLSVFFKTDVNNLKNKDTITNQQIIESLKLSKNWLLSDVDQKTNLLHYQYDISSDSYSKENNHVRQLGTLWAITQLNQLFKDDSLKELIQNTLNYYLKFKKTNNNWAQINVDGQSPIAHNAFVILSLLNISDWPQKDQLLSELSLGILNQQQPDGSYKTNFFSDKSNGVDYYPGEAMLALMKLYQYNKNSQFLTSVNKAFPYYQNYFRKNRNMAFVPWQTQTFFLNFNQTQNPDIANFIFEMNDWLIDKHPSPLGAVYLEGINDAYTLSKTLKDSYHQQKYAQSIKLGIEYLLKTQVNEKNSSNIKNPAKAIGGFRDSLNSNQERIDYSQHAISVLIKTLQNKLFQEKSNSQVKILMKDKSFEPDMITIKKGDRVTFVNSDNKSHWPASDIHPIHGIYPEFDPKRPIKRGESWSFTFSKVGHWRFHDHITPSTTGTIIVTE